MERRKIRNENDAKTCLAEAAQSGLECTAWARAHGIDARSLNAWRLALARRDSAGTPAPIRFIELVAPRAEPAAVYPVHVGRFEVRVPAHFDEACLVRLLRAVASC